MSIGTISNADVITPTEEEAKLAEVSLRQLVPLMPAEGATLELAIPSADGEVKVRLPKAALKAFTDMLAAMAAGDSVSIIPVHAELSTKEAADLLNVSRPFLIGLLKSGEIPFRKVGTHRRVRFSDLMAFKSKSDRDRAEALDELARIAQEHNMGYDP